MSKPAPRPWYRIHRSTLVVLAVTFAWMVFINIPGDRMPSGSRFYHGWPYWYFERGGGEWDFWSFTSTTTKFHLTALLLNVGAAFCIVALVACATELWIRRYGRLWRFSVTSLLLFTAILAAVMGFVMSDFHRCRRQQQALRELADFGSVTTTRDLRNYDWFRSLFGAEFPGTVTRITLTANRPVEVLPDLSGLQDLEYMWLGQMSRIPENVRELAKLPKLKHLSLTLIDTEDAQRLSLLSEVPQLKSLWLTGDGLDDASVMHLSEHTQVEYLNLRSSKITSRSFEKLSELRSLQGLSFDRVALGNSDFSPLAKSPELTWVNFVGCKLTPQDEDKLRQLWPDAEVEVGVGPVVSVRRRYPRDAEPFR